MIAKQVYDVVLVVMPFAPLRGPSLGVGILHSSVGRLGLLCKTLSFNITFAEMIGAEDYVEVLQGRSTSTEDLLGEWLFSGSLFGDDRLDVDGYVGQVLRGQSRDHERGRGGTYKTNENVISRLIAVRANAAPFLDRCVEQIVALRPKVVGLTSMFQQHVPALALAKHLRTALPESFLVMGGANCEGPMGAETARSFPFLDAVVSGEADTVFPRLVGRVMRGEGVAGLKGVFGSGQLPSPPDCEKTIADPVKDLDALPWPDYRDYFQQLAAARIAGAGGEIQIMFETARGCWWAQKNQCTFCGLNGTARPFRSKSPARALKELEHLVRCFPGRPVAVTDNVMDPRYLRSFFPTLRDRDLGVRLFYEVRPSLRKADVQLLKEAGVSYIQPGIESLSTTVLRLMSKGVTAIQNVQFLKWSLEVGVSPIWGILWGFPGEDPAEYARMKDLVPLIEHLPAPQYMTRFRLDRFSPNFSSAQDIGLCEVEPYPSYSFVYPLPPESVRNLAYFFRYTYGVDRGAYTEALADAAAEWRDQQAHTGLVYLDKERWLVVIDLRRCARQPVYLLDEDMRWLYLQCDRISSLRELHEASSDRCALDVEAALRDLVDAKLIIREDDQYLSLAVDFEVFEPPVGVIERLACIVDQRFTPADGGRAISQACFLTVH